MLPELAPTASAYATGHLMLHKLVEDFTPGDWGVTDACGHTPRWVVGHLATYRHRVLTILGLPAPAYSWEAAFARGSSPADVPDDLDMEAVLASFREAHTLMAARWDLVTPDLLARPAGRRLPDGSEDLGGALRFLAWHEAYHLGQLGLLRRLGGRPGLA